MSGRRLQLEWLKRAKRDLANIEAWYLETAGEQVSDAAVDAVYYQVIKIQERPQLYRKGHRHDVHEAVLKTFPLLVRYQIKASKIRILRIFHQRQQRR